MNDAEALKLAILGREEGFKAIFTSHSSFLFTHAMRILKNRQSAEDAVQETFTAAFNAISSFRGEAKLRTWLYQILYRSSLRLSYRENKTPDFESAGYSESRSGDIDLKHDVDKVLNSLNERDRAILIMTYWDEMPAKEAAQVLEVSENNAKIILFRARSRFAGLWAKTGGKDREKNAM